ncbi:exopolysaccharide biosynthesis polyprenyl glycosylphosphotransferase [Aquipseudomonas ullengensis]|uniref:Exopolysaccharide biosynthesis polyprenyl glycosylphosphotransferase n=1 Tax=Aquipseudomonas ullengensis TaxID=2759166 RepID=A0A7W4LI00_9GAMM|nr:exopolysaccharide biosynthesis polyprenyl glycosylphosphotransferase [Pseudomonas ullengensis]MBB2493535.1 exopolysaccharide biosynthesis polyprenyl glycosylphosphotransferase [Pseudomonas ullengensis]
MARPKGVRRFDAAALSGVELLLLRLVHALCSFLAVAVLYVYALAVQAEAAADLQLWAVFLTLFAGLMPVRVYGGLCQPHVERALKAVSSLLNAGVAIAVLQVLVLLAGQHGLPPLFLLGLFLLVAVMSLGGRLLLERLVRSWDHKTRLVIVGAGEQGVAIAQHMALSEPNIEVIGFIEDRQSRIDPASLPVPLLGNTSQLEELPRDIDGVVIALPNSAGERVNELASLLRARLGSVYLAPEVPVLRHAFAGWPKQGPHKMMLLGMNRLPVEGRLLKRLFDIGFSACALLAFLPFGLLIATAIKLESPGPVLFRQQRYGLRNQLFGIYKFRSMSFDPDGANKEIRLTARGDSRVTRVGDFLRRSSLDEFPQFLNVLLGHMSVVGPRPHPPGVKAGDRIYEAVVVDFVERYKVRPGITGWAQVNGLRGNTFTEEHLTERFSYDIQYIQNWSVELDLWIVTKTVLGGFGGKNAF